MHHTKSSFRNTLHKIDLSNFLKSNPKETNEFPCKFNNVESVDSALHFLYKSYNLRNIVNYSKESNVNKFVH